jgi:hypothetical protein
MGFDEGGSLARKASLDEQYKNFIVHAVKIGGIRTKRELAMFLTHVVVTSRGLSVVEEPRCVLTKCPNEYDHTEGYAGQHYYGRGYMQLVV